MKACHASLRCCFSLFLTFLIFNEKIQAEEGRMHLPPPPIPANSAEQLDKKISDYLSVRAVVKSAALEKRTNEVKRYVVAFSKAGIRRFKRRAHVMQFRDIHVQEALLKNRKLRRIHTFELPGMRAFAVKATDINQLSLLEKSGFITYEADYKLEQRETAPNDPFFASQWALRNTGQYINAPGDGGVPGIDLKATYAWDTVTSSTNVVTAVCDTGLDITHPDISPNVWTNPKEIANNGIDDDGNGWTDDVRGADVIYYDGLINDDFGHGTAVAGVIGAKGNNGTGVAGVNWNSKLLALKAIDENGISLVTDWIVALDYAAMMKRRFDDSNPNNGGANIKVFNLSSGLAANCNPTGNPAHPIDLFLASARAAGQAGILFVSAASNDAGNHDVTPDFPTNCNLTNHITVANITRFGVLDCTVPLVGGICPAGQNNGSGYGATSVDIAAPGSDIISTSPGSSYIIASGTSLATPYVSGVAALIAGLNPSLSPESIRSLIISTATQVPALNGKVVANGMLDARAVIPGIMGLLPGFSAQPANQSIASGSTANFSVTATGASPRTFQWLKNDAVISGATSQTYQIAGATTANNGQYKCRVTNAYGVALSNPATLTVSAGTSPLITSHPQNKSSVVGQSTSFTCGASGSPAPTYQWQKSGINIPGATSATYTFSPVIGDHGKTFRCIATNPIGSVLSNSALLTVTLRGDFDRDGCVTGSDLLMWQRSFGGAVTPLTSSDGNGDGNIDVADYTIWRDMFGQCR